MCVDQSIDFLTRFQPSRQHSYFANLAIEEPKWPIASVRQALKPLTRKDLQAFAAPESLFGQGFGTALLQVRTRISLCVYAQQGGKRI
jgi:hypothetical protein